MLWFQVAMVTSVCLAFEITCPNLIHWHYRAKSICKDETTYMCLFHEMNSIYTENCDGPDGIQRGFKLVLRPHVINSHCERSRYQPIPFNTTGNSDCIYKKSICTDEGLVVHKIGTNSSDTSCRCDYRKGYTFVKTPKNTCYCLPSLEDCSCYLKKCETLTPEYFCQQEDPLTPGLKCQSISNDVDGIDKEEVIVHPHKDDEIRAKDFNVIKCIIGSTVIVMLIVLCSISIMIVRRHSIIHLKEEVQHAENTETTFEEKEENETQVKGTDIVLPGIEEVQHAEKTETTFEEKEEKEVQHAEKTETTFEEKEEKEVQHAEKTETTFEEKEEKDKSLSEQRKIEFESQGENTFVRQISESNTKESRQKQFNEKTLEVWKKRDIVYFETDFFKSVEEKLEGHNCVTLIGASGEGKTLTAIHAALTYRRKSPPYDVLVIHDANDLIKSINFKVRQFFVVDDPLGKQFLDEHSLVSWLQCSKQLRDCLSGDELKIIATIRKPLFQKNEMRIKETIFYENTIDLSSENHRLTVLDKQGVLDKNIKFHDKEITCEMKDAIVNDTYHPGFPLFCHLISSNHSFTSYNVIDPCCVIKAHLKEFQKLKSEPFHYCCLVLAFMFDNVFDTNNLTSCEDMDIPGYDFTDKKKISNILKSCQINTADKTCFSELKSGFEALSGAYFLDNRPIYKILHGSITSCVADIYGKENIIMLIEYSGSSVISEYVRTRHDTSDVDNVQIIVRQEFQINLAKRFINDIKRRKSGYVFSHPSFKDEDFQLTFLDAVIKKDASEILEIMSMAPKTENAPVKDIREYIKFALDVAILGSTGIHWLCRLGLYKILTSVLLKTDDQLRYLKELPGHTTPLHFAAGYGHIKIVQYLVDLGVDVDLKAKLVLTEDQEKGQYFSGFTPLLYAARQNHLDVVEYLLQKGANPNLVRDHGGSPMLLAAIGGHTDVIKQLLKFKGEPNLCCEHGTTPIILAAQEGYLETVLTLIKGGADVNKQKIEKEGKFSALLASSQKGHTGCIVSLVENGADIELCDAEGSTPLLIALKNQQYEAAKILYKIGSSINTKNKKGEYPLQLATTLNLQIFSDSNK